MNTKTKIPKRILSILLSVLTLLSMMTGIPITASAVDEYLIYTINDLMNFAIHVNAGNKSTNGKLMANIDMTDVVWTPIASTALYHTTTTYSDKGYTGTFDGQGYVISNLTVKGSSTEDKSFGLFGTLSGTVKNLGMYNFKYTGAGKDSRVGPVAGQMLDGSLIEKCYTATGDINTKVNTTNGVAGGIAGCNYAGIIRDCFQYNYTINAARKGGIVGDNYGDMNNSDGSDRPGVIENCYTNYGNLSEHSAAGREFGECGVSNTRFTTGEIAYKLNYSVNNGTFKQSIGSAYPSLTGSGVYAVKDCFGTAKSYTNNEADALTSDHKYDTNGKCSVCGIKSDGIYYIANANDLFNFATYVNASDSSANAKLTADIDLANKEWTSIGSERRPFTGTFDGQGYTIKNYKQTIRIPGSNGFFGMIQDATVKNFTISGQATTACVYNGGNIGVVGMAKAVNAYCYITNVHSKVNFTMGDNYTKGATGGVVGNAVGKSSSPWNYVIIERCTYSGKMNLGTQYCDCTGGIVGYIAYTSVVKTEKCLFAGSITTEYKDNIQVGGILGYNRGANYFMKNCLSVGTITVVNTTFAGQLAGRYLQTSSNGASRVDTVMKNNYYRSANSLPAVSNTSGMSYSDIEMSDFDTFGDDNAKSVTNAQLKSGEIAYKLGSNWGQKIGTDSNPVVDGNKVYYGYDSCADNATMVYTNTSATSTKPAHKYTNGSCSVCKKACSHSWSNGICTICKKACSHSWQNSTCTICGEACKHNYENGKCTICNKACSHSWEDGKCTVCSKACSHSWEDGECTVCSKACSHSWEDGECTVCSKACSHSWENGECTVCSKACSHSWENGECTVCSKACSHSWENGKCTICNKPCSHSWEDGKCTVCSKACEHNVVNGTCTICNKIICEHKYTNGFCTECDAYEPATLTTDKHDITGDGKNDTVYEISNAGQLYWFAQKINNGEHKINCKLTDDIVVNQNVLNENGSFNGDGSQFRKWIPIGYGEGNYFNGVFHGDNHTISGLYCNDSSMSEIGLISRAGNGTAIRNVGVIDSYFYGSNHVGGIVGILDGFLINCYNTGTVRGNSYIGGVIGSIYYGDVVNCYNTGYVVGDANVGGVAGENACGYIIQKCYNSGTVKGNSSVGGVIGYAKLGGINEGYNRGTVEGSSSVGGVIGYIESSGIITNCYSSGNIVGKSNIGGILGEIKKDVDTKINNCYYLTGTAIGGINGADIEGFAEVKTFDEFKSGEIAYLLQAAIPEKDIYDDYGKYLGKMIAEVWGQKIGTDNFPVFGGTKVYQVKNCKDETVYSNTNENGMHKWENGTCTVCSKICEHKWESGKCTVCSTACEHNKYENGFCTICGAYEPATLTTDKYDVNGDNVKDTVYEIANANQLYWFADKVNNDYVNYGSANAVLTYDIVVNEGTMTDKTTDAIVWTPIGGSKKKYNGTFDGQGHTISGLYYNNPDVRYVGLFAYTNENSVIRNIGIVDSYFYATGNVGAIAGSSRGEITNCYNKSTISGTNNNIGGIAGCMEYGSIIDCYNTGSVSAEKSNYVGGIVGYVNLSSPKMIRNCYNTGNISGVFQVGGIVGYSVNYNTTDNITIENCYNTGNIYGRSYTDFYDYTKFPSHIGGIAGSTSGRIINCYNVGSITCDEGATNVGGILGTAYHRAMVVIDNCYSVKDFNCPEDVTFDVICGDKNEAIITNCYEKSYEQFASGEVAYLLQGEQTEQIWGQDINNGESVQKHPTFTGAKVYQITNCKNETIYSNTNENIDHNYENGICTGCGGTDPSIVNISIVGDITLKLEKTGDNIFTGDISLDAGTYQFRVAHNNVLLGFNGTYTDTATIDYTVSDIESTIFNVTGGKYTFTYNASTKNLVIDYIPPQVLGDVNWDSTIDIRDVIFVMQHIVGTITFDENQSFYADMDSDGIVSVMDVLYLQKMLLGMV